MTSLIPKRRSSDSLVDDIKKNNVSCYEKIGKGTMSTAYSCYYKNGKTAVVKITNVNHESIINNAIREIFTLKTIQAAGGFSSIINLQSFEGNEFNTPYFNMFFDKYDINLVDFLSKNTLVDRIKLFKDFTRDISEAIDFLHQQKFYHLDIKPDNILVNNVYTNSLCRSPRPVTFYLADFSHTVHKTTEANSDFVFTPIITPPEYYFEHLIEDNKDCYYNEKSDIWCFGIVLIYFITRRFIYDYPFPCKTEKDIMKRILSLGRYLDFIEPEEKVNFLSFAPIFYEDDTLRKHIIDISGCLYFHQGKRKLPVTSDTITVPYLQIANTLKYGFTTQEVNLRWKIIMKIRSFFKIFDDYNHNNFIYFIYNYDTFLLKSGKNNFLTKAVMILRILIRVIFTVNNKDLEYLIQTEFGDSYQKNVEIYQLALNSFVIPPILTREYERKQFFNLSRKKLYLIVNS